MKECTFRPKVDSKVLMKKNRSEHLRNKISKSLSPNRVFQLDKFDISTIKQSRLRIERNDDKISNFVDQMSPKV